jgi:hypothetical protein
VKGVKAKGRGSCYQTGDQGGWEFVTTSKKLALQVSWGSLLSLQGVDENAVYCVNMNIRMSGEYNETFVCRLKINHARSSSSSCV